MQGGSSGLSGGRTNTETVSAVLKLVPSNTISENSRSVRTDGDVKLGFCAVALLSVTPTPPVWVQT